MRLKASARLYLSKYQFNGLNWTKHHKQHMYHIKMSNLSRTHQETLNFVAKIRNFQDQLAACFRACLRTKAKLLFLKLSNDERIQLSLNIVVKTNVNSKHQL